MQRLDTSDKAILESYGEDLLGHLIKEEKDILKVTMGDGTFMEVSKQSEISLNIDNYNHYTISVRDPKAATFRQVTGSTSDLVNNVDLSKSILKIISNVQNILAIKYGYKEFRYPLKKYKPTKGIDAGKIRSVYKLNNQGNQLYHKDGTPKFNSKNAYKHYQKGLKLGKIVNRLGYLGVGLKVYDIYRNNWEMTTKDIVDGMVLALCFIPKIGWIIGGVYFILDIFGVIDWLIDKFSDEPKLNLEYFEFPKTQIIDKVEYDNSSEIRKIDDYRYNRININIPILKNEEKGNKKN
ncbi:hypothetical protein [Capnocytophaga cynodegmi]|uniref:hypothetical protein n=1 Tax=Capnocytophaga cynodegmi TaxID=28189 RepID=UPI001AC97EBE|nr:hypothetical protein [Capnocytophaga cynodegmi]GIM54271.1 hypothetical protein CAPN005_09180 [Capnocytophaga cynodegmi]